MNDVKNKGDDAFVLVLDEMSSHAQGKITCVDSLSLEFHIAQ